MLRLPRPALGSAHAIALLALTLSIGGGYAVAQSALTPQPTIAYHETRDASRTIERRGATLIGQLVVPTDRAYVVDAKLDVAKPRGGTAGTVTCVLAAIGRKDRSTVSVAPGRTATLSLQAAGAPAAPLSGDTQAADLFCRASSTGPYVVSHARMTAIAVDAVR